jgi:hypothetical protein
MMVQTWLWFWAAISPAGLAAARYEADQINPLHPSISVGPFLSTSTAEASTLEVTTRTTHLDTKSTAHHVTVQETTGTSVPTTGSTQTNENTDKSPTTAEPDVSFQIVFSILGTLLALASVVVAVFFGYKQLKGTPNQPSVIRHDAANSGSDVDLEMGPVPAPSDPAPPVADQIFTHVLGTRFADFFNKLEPMNAATSRPSLRHEGQLPPSPPDQNLATVHKDLSAPVDILHEQ